MTSYWMYGGIIPVLPEEDLYLLGREQDGRWSWFGGHAEPDDTSIYKTAAREAYEESMGLLGSINGLEERVIESPRIQSTFFVSLSLEEARFIPTAFRRVYNYLSNCQHFGMGDRARFLGCPQGYLEKTEIRWFSWDEMISPNSGVDSKDLQVILQYRTLLT